MNDLIAMLEAATGPDRELDGAIFWFAKRAQAVRYFHNAAVGKPSQSLPDELPAHGLGRHAVVQFAPHYTASIDAALTLVPDGWNRRFSESDTHEWWAELRQGHETSYGSVVIGRSSGPALALSIAALKAIAVSGKRDAHSTGQQK